jgi:hypothetical protein
VPRRFGSTRRSERLNQGSVGLQHGAPADGAVSPGATPSAPLGLPRPVMNPRHAGPGPGLGAEASRTPRR